MGHKNRKGYNKQKLKKLYDQQYPVKKSFWRKVWDYLCFWRWEK